MRRLASGFLAVSLLFISVSNALADGPAHFWSKRFGGTGTDLARSTAVDAAGNVYLAGSFSNSVSFGGAILTSAGLSDLYVAKFTSDGNHVWSLRVGGLMTDEAMDVAVDATGAVLVLGYFKDVIYPGPIPLGSAGAEDILLLKYDSSGSLVWQKSFGSTAVDIGWGVAVDNNNYIVITGQFGATVNFGGGNLVSAGDPDVFLARYDTNGNHVWSRRYGSTGTDYGYDVAVDGLGYATATGKFAGTVNFGGGNLVSAGAGDIFLVQCNPLGGYVWSGRYGGTGNDEGHGVACDAGRNVFMTGYFYNTADFGGGNLTSNGLADVVVAKYSQTGVHQWSARFGGASYDKPSGIATDADGRVAITGFYEGNVDFGGGGIAAYGDIDLFVAAYDANGAHRWSAGYGDTNQDDGYAVACDAAGNVIATGFFRQTVNFGGGPLTSAGLADIPLIKFGADPTTPVISAISDIGNDQGRQVLIQFARSGFDDPGSPATVTQYEAFRRIDAPPPSATALRDVAGLSARALLAGGWTQVGTVAAHGESGYSMVVPTIGDSTIAHGPYLSTFFVRAATASPYSFFDSPADSGYSLDNLAPGVPQHLVYNAGDLAWDESSAGDFDYFTVYGSNTDAFGTATRVDYCVDPMLDVTASPHVFYFVTATDFSGNEGRPARINTLTGTGGTPTQYVLSVSNYPNPFNPRTTVSYTVPSHGAVTVAVYDLRGAHVATLVKGADRAAGAYDVEWNGRTNSGVTASSGVYFVRIEHNGATQTKKMVLLK